MPFQPRLTDFTERPLPNSGSDLYHACSKRLKVLQLIAGHTPLIEIRRLLFISKQALNSHLFSLVGKGWVERVSRKRGEGIYQVTPEGVKALQFGKPPVSDGVLPVNVLAANWLSVHFFKVRFNLKGERFDKTGLQKNARNRWVEYFDNPPITLECRKRCLTVTVHGLKGGDAVALARVGLERAREAALAFCGRRGARVFSQGEFSGMPHWVVEELSTSRELKGLLGLAAGRPAVRLAGLEWYVDRSHGELVEARGELDTAKLVFKNFGYLLDGSLKRDLELVRGELVGVKEVAFEVRALREELRFKPGVGLRREVS